MEKLQEIPEYTTVVYWQQEVLLIQIKTDMLIITSCSSTISGSGYVGGIVGLLDGSSRVINCFSYANITGGNYVGGIVGITMWPPLLPKPQDDGDELHVLWRHHWRYSKAPIYNGEIITNRGDANGVSNFNYFWAGASYVRRGKTNDNVYNCALLLRLASCSALSSSVICSTATVNWRHGGLRVVATIRTK